MESSQQPKTSKNSTSNLETRRKLLKASASLPVIATLFPGSAMAVSSFSCERCVDPNANPDSYTTAPDNYMRKEARRCVYKDDNHGRCSKKKRKENKYPRVMFYIDGQFYSRKGKLITRRDLPWGCYEETPIWVLVYYDCTDGIPTQVTKWPISEKTNHGGIPLTQSCWTSFDTYSDSQI